MAKEPTRVITLEVDADGVLQELKLNDKNFSVSADRKQEGQELLDAFAKAAGAVLALESEPATRGGI